MMCFVFDEETGYLWSTQPSEDVPTAVDVVVCNVNGEELGKLECVPLWVLYTIGRKASKAWLTEKTRMQNDNKSM